MYRHHRNIIIRHGSIILIALAILLTFPRNAFSAEHTHTAGVILNTYAAGIEYQYRPFEHFGIMAMALYVSGEGLDLGEKDYMYTTGLSVVAHPKGANPVFDPVFFFGAVYSRHHWEHSTADTEGTIHDLTIGGGTGIGFIIYERIRIGLNLWVNYDYKTNEDAYTRYKADRFLLFVPAVTLSILF